MACGRNRKEVDIIDSSSNAIGNLPSPKTKKKLFDIDLYKFFCADLPDFWSHTNEGLLKLSLDTLLPQERSTLDEKLSIRFAVEFRVKDNTEAPSFLKKGVLRNAIFEDWINLAFDLYEIDSGVIEAYNSMKRVVAGVPELETLDILKGIPYLSVAAKLVDGIINVFGKNQDDYIWGETPILELSPTLGGAFLRDGIYVVFQNSYKKSAITFSDLGYKDGDLFHKKAGAHLPNYLIFGIRLKDFNE